MAGFSQPHLDILNSKLTKYEKDKLRWEVSHQVRRFRKRVFWPTNLGPTLAVT
jgi:hypothetical protein